MKKKHSNQDYDLMSKNLNNWRGPFYVNRKDPRFIVPKLTPSLGWTLNFANPYAYLSIIGLIVVIIASQYFLKE